MIRAVAINGRTDAGDAAASDAADAETSDLARAPARGRGASRWSKMGAGGERGVRR